MKPLPKSLIFAASLAANGVLAALPSGPLSGPVYLVAGSGSPGFKDGAFEEAEFSGPSSIVLSPDRKFLYVSDTGNNALRAVHLDEGCVVSTLAGSGEPGKADGTAATARLKHPGRLRIGPGARALYFLDQDGTSLRAFDLLSQSVKTVLDLGLLSGGKNGPCFDFSSSGAGIFYTRPDQNSLMYASLDGSVTKTVAVDPVYGLAKLSFHVSNGRFLYLRPDTGQVWGLQEQFLGGAAPASTPISLIGPAAGFSWCDKAETGAKACLIGFDTTLNALRFLSVPAFVNTTISFQDLRGIAPEEITKSARPILMGALGLTYDFTARTAYVAEAQSNRIMGYRYLDAGTPQALNPDGMKMFSYSPEKQHGVTRNVMVGSSISFVSDTTVPDQLLPKQLEEHWNLFNYLSHKTEREEVIFQGEHLGSQAGAGISFALGYGGSWAKVHADRVILTVTYLDLVAEAMSFTRAATPGDIAPAYVDNEWLTKSEAEKDKSTGPLSLAFKNTLRKKITAYNSAAVVNKDGGIYDPGTWNHQNLMKDPEMKSEILAIYRHRLQAFKKKAAKEGCQVAGVLIPVRNQLSRAEMVGGGRNYEGRLATALVDEDLRELFKGEGIAFINLTTEMRVMGATHFPLVKWSDDHYNARGHHFLGLLLAWRLSEALSGGH